MTNDNERIHVEFHNNARTIYFFLLEEFGSFVKQINRQEQEYKFKEVKNKYVNTLRLRLEIYAMVLVQRCRHLQKSNELKLSLESFIKDYLHHFVQKIRSA